MTVSISLIRDAEGRRQMAYNTGILHDRLTRDTVNRGLAMVETAKLLYLTSKGSNIVQKQSYGTVRNVLAANCSSAKHGCVISSFNTPF